MKINTRLTASILAILILSGGEAVPRNSSGASAPRRQSVVARIRPGSDSSNLSSALASDLPDLIIRQIMSIKGHEIRVAVSNLGQANSESCLIRAEVWKNGEVLVKRDGNVKPLHPGQYNIVTIDTSPQEVSENGYIIKLKVDPTDAVKESNEDNNSKCKGCIAIPGKK